MSHTRKEYEKYAKFVTNFKLQKFYVTTPHCSDSVTTWVTWCVWL